MKKRIKASNNGNDDDPRVLQLRKTLTSLFETTNQQLAQIASIEDMVMDTRLHPILGELHTAICDLQAEVFGVMSDLRAVQKLEAA